MTGKNLFGLSDQMKERLASEMLAKHRKKVEKEQNRTGSESNGGARKKLFRNDAIPDEYSRFDSLPGYQQIRVIETGGKQLGIPSPFFKTHDQVAGATTQIAEQEYINFASYNYLDLCGHPSVNEAAKAAIDRYGTSASAKSTFM